jgi:hypothetical protein
MPYGGLFSMHNHPAKVVCQPGCPEYKERSQPETRAQAAMRRDLLGTGKVTLDRDYNAEPQALGRVLDEALGLETTWTQTALQVIEAGPSLQLTLAQWQAVQAGFKLGSGRA